MKNFNFLTFLNSFSFLLALVLLVYTLVVVLYFYSKLNESRIKLVEYFLPNSAL